MQAVIISYPSGMFGEFTADLIHRSGNSFCKNNESTKDDTNRFLFPNYLLPIGVDVKTFPSAESWPISDTQINTLTQLYKNQKFCIPTHWYNDNISLTNIPSIGLKLISNDPQDINLAYCLSWLKSHVNAQTLWPARQQEIINLIKAQHPQSKQLETLLTDKNYQNWKFICYKMNLPADLSSYIATRYEWYKKWATGTGGEQWNTFDIGQLVHGSGANCRQLESLLDLTIDKNIIEQYRNSNVDMLKSTLGISNLSGTDWLEHLKNYCLEKLT